MRKLLVVLFVLLVAGFSIVGYSGVGNNDDVLEMEQGE